VIATLEPTIEEESDHIEFFDLCEDFESLERRVRV
jgi:hypothetical protein